MAKILFFVTEDWYFCSHRLHLAVAAKQAGYDVTVVTQVNTHGALIEGAGLKLLPVKISRGGFNPFADACTLLSLIGIYRRIRPDIVHHVAMKPVLYGSLAARITGVPHVVNAMAGMGFVFSSDSPKARYLRPWIRRILRRLLNGRVQRLIVQNPDDRRLFVEEIGIEPERICVIEGSGVDVSQFRPVPPPPASPVVITLVARMLKDKGVREFVDAARILKHDGLDVRAVLVGEEDLENPACIHHQTLLEWVQEGVVEWWGRREDIPAIWQQSHIAVLPSYREGLPKSLLEAAACGCPVIATDVPGCREVVRDGVTGLLVKPRDASSLAEAIHRLVQDERLRDSMGKQGHTLVEQCFSNEMVQRKTLALYQELLES